MSSARSIAAIASLPQMSCCEGEGTGTSREISEAISVGLDAGVPDDLAPLRVVFADEAPELGRRVGRQLDSLRPELRLELGAAQDLHHLAVDLHHHLLRRLRRHEQAEPGIERVAGNGL